MHIPQNKVPVPQTYQFYQKQAQSVPNYFSNYLTMPMMYTNSPVKQNHSNKTKSTLQQKITIEKSNIIVASWNICRGLATKLEEIKEVIRTEKLGTRAAMRPLLLRRAVNLASALRAYLPENFCDAANLRCAQLSFHTFFHLRGFILRYLHCTQIILISVSILTH